MLRGIAFCLLAALTVGGSAHATCPTFSTLTNGTTADANVVMSNFDYILQCPDFTGNVGIGTSTADYPLTVTNSGGIYVHLNSPASSNQVSTLYSENGSWFWQLGLNGDHTFFLWDSVAARNDIVVSSNSNMQIMPVGGYVGIGAVWPGYELQVAGSIYASGTISSSDIRLKDKIAPLTDNALALVEKLRPVSFFWKIAQDDGMKGEQWGFIAQEVEQALPSVVLTQKDAAHTKGIKYQEFIPLLTKAIQQQQAQISALVTENRGYAAKLAEARAANVVYEAKFVDLEKRLAAVERKGIVRTAQSAQTGQTAN